jgi:hypothetical protein
MPYRNALMLVLPLLSAVPMPAAACSIEQAVYRIDGAAGFQITFRKAETLTAWSDLDAILTTPSRELVLGMTASNGYPEEFLVLEDPDGTGPADAGSFRFFSFDKGLQPQGLPSSDHVAPDYLLIPDLGSYLFYYSGQQEFLPTGMWRRQGCP